MKGRARAWVLVAACCAAVALPTVAEGAEAPAQQRPATQAERPAPPQQRPAPQPRPAPPQERAAPQAGAAPQQPAAAQQPQPTPEETAQRETAAAQPGEIHRAMAARVGDFTTVTRFRTAPDAAPQESSGTARITSIMDGRFLLEEGSGAQGGQTVTTWRLWGLNNGSQRYESVWVWNLSTGLLNLSGTSTDGGRTIDWTGSYDDATGQSRALQGRTRQPDADHFTIELFGPGPDGKPFTVVETEYTRAPAGAGG